MFNVGVFVSAFFMIIAMLCAIFIWLWLAIKFISIIRRIFDRLAWIDDWINDDTKDGISAAIAMSLAIAVPISVIMGFVAS